MNNFWEISYTANESGGYFEHAVSATLTPLDDANASHLQVKVDEAGQVEIRNMGPLKWRFRFVRAEDGRLQITRLKVDADEPDGRQIVIDQKSDEEMLIE